MQNLLKRKFGPKFNVFVLQLTVITVIIIGLTVVRFVGGNTYSKVMDWYVLHFGAETSVDDVIKNDYDLPASDSAQTDSPQVVNTAAIGDTKTVIIPKSKTVGSNSLFTPVDSATLTSGFGDRENPVTFAKEKHKGLDMATESGSPVYAAASGSVVYSANSPTYGNYLIVDHGNGLKTLYAHCSKLLKTKGDTVNAGEKIALVGSTGQSTGPHLHFEIIINGINVDPKWLLDIK